MPIYDYGCTNCGHVVEVVHGVHEPGPTVCPECGGLLRKRISSPAIHFRGTGWAKKDARQAIAARSGKGKSDGTGDSKSDGASDSSKKDTSDSDSDSSAKESAASSKGEKSPKGSGAATGSSGSHD